MLAGDAIFVEPGNDQTTDVRVSDLTEGGRLAYGLTTQLDRSGSFEGVNAV